MVEQRLFGTSGIRGVVNVDLSPKLALQIGLALATYTNAGEVAVGNDTRISSPLLKAAFISGLLSGGSSVHRLGLTPTPVLAFLTRELEADAGAMITASHNPPEYNGIKLFSSDTTPFNEEAQKEIEKIINQDLFKRCQWQDIKEADLMEETDRYVEAVTGALELERDWRVILDSGCGSTCNLAPTLLRRLGCEVTAINSHPDGYFPGRGPGLESRSLRTQSRMVRQLHADIGFAYDGDGDRLAIIDEKGKLSSPDQTLTAYATHMVKKYGGGVVVTTVETSMCFEEAVDRYDGTTVRTKVGDVEVATAVKKHNALFGGEPCGAWVHPEHHYCPDGLLSSALLLQALEDENKDLSSFLSEVPRYPLLREKIPCPLGGKSRVMRHLEKTLPDLYPEIEKKQTIDGLRLNLSEGWILIRPSGTEPLIRLTVEAKALKEAEKIMNQGLRQVKKSVEESTE